MQLQNLMKRGEQAPGESRKQLVLESYHTRHYIEAGATFQSEDGVVTVLCVLDPEICYFQGGLIYTANKLHFHRMVMRAARGIGKDISGSPSLRPLTPMEIEFTLGAVSVVGPLECWTIVGNDLVRFFTENQKRIDEWNLRIAALLIARMVLKKYAGVIYERVSLSLMGGVWSNLSGEIATDDTFIGRFTGRLWGSYRSEAVMGRAIEERWAVFKCVFDILESLGNIGTLADENQNGELHVQAEGFVRSLRQHGIGISRKDICSLLEVTHHHLPLINSAGTLLNVTFEGCHKPEN